MFVIIKKGEIVGTKGVSQNHLLCFDDNKVLKNCQLDMPNIFSSVQDHNQSLIHRGSSWTSQRAKEFILELKASEENAPEEKHSWRWCHQKLSVSEGKQILKPRHQKHLIRSYFTRRLRALTKYSVRDVQPLTLRLPLQPPSLHLVSTSRQE